MAPWIVELTSLMRLWRHTNGAFTAARGNLWWPEDPALLDWDTFVPEVHHCKTAIVMMDSPWVRVLQPLGKWVSGTYGEGPVVAGAEFPIRGVNGKLDLDTILKLQEAVDVYLFRLAAVPAANASVAKSMLFLICQSKGRRRWRII